MNTRSDSAASLVLLDYDDRAASGECRDGTETPPHRQRPADRPRHAASGQPARGGRPHRRARPHRHPDGAETVDARRQWLAPGILHLGVFATDKPPFHFRGITSAALLPDSGPPDGAGLVPRDAKASKPDLW